MRLSTAGSLALAALLVVSLLGAAAASPWLASSDSEGPSPSAAEFRSAQTSDRPEQIVRISMTTTGSAEWTIESRYTIGAENGTFNDTESFYAYAEAVAAGERDVGYDADTYERYADLAQQSTEREMAILSPEWNDPRVEQWGDANSSENGTVGVISFSFRWTNFARTDGNRIYLGDVFHTEDGTWFGRLSSGQRLVIEPPSNYGYEEIPRVPRDGALVWDGPYEFDDGEIRVTYLQGAEPTETSPTETSPTETSPTETSPTETSPTETSPTGTDTTVGTPTDDGDGGILSSNSVWLGLVVLLLIVGGGGYYLARVDRPGPDDSGDESDPSAGAAAAAEAADETEPTDVTSFDEEEVIDDVDVELLSDEERVHRLLRQNNGRMKQAMIVKETGWSNAKVSQLLSEMDENDEIEKLRIGRENLITLPEVDPTEVD